MGMNSLSHSKWECKYHVVFAPKFRRKVIYGKLKQDIANILSMLCKRGVEIVGAEVCPDHVHNAGKNSTEYECLEFYGVFEREKYAYDIRETCQSEI